jgi:quercetin dioxygenase-like cupin family protein
MVEGEAEIVISGQSHHLHGGEMILMPAGNPHALKAMQRFKMILTMIRS